MHGESIKRDWRRKTGAALSVFLFRIRREAPDIGFPEAKSHRSVNSVTSAIEGGGRVFVQSSSREPEEGSD